jgi:hypothetical protein
MSYCKRRCLMSLPVMILRSSPVIVLSLLASSLMLTACNRPVEEVKIEIPKADLKKVTRMIPSRVAERKLWATDIISIMDTLKIERNLENTCSIIAVVDQESNFIADPSVPGLGKKAAVELNERLTAKLGAAVAERFTSMLEQRPTPEENFAKRLEKVKTEQQLDALYREMFEYFKSHYKLGLVTGAASIVAGHDMAEYFNPVKTLGSMQVHIQYALEHPREISNSNAIRDSMYTRDGGLYYGIHRLMGYPADYDKPLYRFADFNSGMYSSRNATIQKATATLTGLPISLDGDLLSYNKDKDALSDVTSTEAALRRVIADGGGGISDRALRKDLLLEKQAEFEQTETYTLVRGLYEAKTGKPLPYAMMPEVVISGPKLSRDYNTNWYANRVNGRYLKCRRVGKQLGLK